MRQDAEILRASYIQQYRQGQHAWLDPPDNPPVDEFWQRYLAWATSHKARTTVMADKRAWNELLLSARKRRVRDITRQDVERMKTRLTKDGLSPASVNMSLRHLKAIFNAARKEGFYSGPNPVTDVRQYRIPKTKPTFLSSEEVEKLLTAAKAHSESIYWVCLLGCCAGLRKGELVNARWEWFDFDQRLITVKRGPGFEVKDGEERVIPMASRLYDVLYPHRQPTGYLFVSGRRSSGRHLYRYEPKKALQSVAEAAGLQVGFHLLRHTFGSLLAQRGVSIFKISKWMGHSSVDVTARHYAALQDYDADIDKL